MWDQLTKTEIFGKIDCKFSFVMVIGKVRWVSPAEGAAASLYLLCRRFGLAHNISFSVCNLDETSVQIWLKHV